MARLMPIIALASFDLMNMQKSMPIQWGIFFMKLHDKLPPIVYDILRSIAGYIGSTIATFHSLDDKPGALFCWIVAGLLPWIALLYTVFFWKKKALRNVQAVCAVIHIVMYEVSKDPYIIADWLTSANVLMIKNYSQRFADRSIHAILVCIFAVFVYWSVEKLQETVPRYINLLKEKVKK